MKYSVTTVCLPEMDLEEQAAFLSRLGYDGLELRVRPLTDEQRQQPYGYWGNHKNDITPETFKDNAERIRSTLSEHGLQLAAIASAMSALDLDQVRLIAEGAQAAGAPAIRAGAAAGYNGTRNYYEIYDETVKAFEAALEITRPLGVKVLLEMHGGTIHPSASLAHRIVSNFDSRDLGVIYDPQNMVRDGFETIQLALELLGPHCAHVHVGGHKPVAGEPDEKGTVNWDWPGCSLAEGPYDYPKMLASLQHIGYQGFISIEDFRDLPSEEKFAEAIAYLKIVE